jgi:hypothetical protein
MKTILTAAVLALALQGERKSNPGFDQIKKLEGSWESVDKDHPTSITYKLSSGGSILVESIAMANHADMLTIYHPDGDGLALTHYCMLGNQPHMKAEKENKPGTLRFVCDGGSNMKCATDKHMHSLVLTFVDADHVKQDWALFDGGKEQAVHTFNLARKKQ